MRDGKLGKWFLVFGGLLAIAFSIFALFESMFALAYGYMLSSAIGLLFAIIAFGSGVIGLKNRNTLGENALSACGPAGIAIIAWLTWLIVNLVTIAELGLSDINFLWEAVFLGSQILIIYGAVQNSRKAA